MCVVNVDKLISVQLYQIINDMRNCFADEYIINIPNVLVEGEVEVSPDAVSPDLFNLWLDSMLISPLELSWEIRWCTTATQSVTELSRKVQVMQTP